MEKVLVKPEILPKNQERVLLFDPTAILTSQVEHHPCIGPIAADGHLEDIFRCLGQNPFVLTPTSLSNPLIVHFRYGHEFSAYELNYMAALLTREAVGNKTLIIGTIDLSFLEHEWIKGHISTGRITASVREQVHALKAGGVDYLLFQGFKSGELLGEFSRTDIIDDLPIAFTVSPEAADKLPKLIIEFQSTTKVFAAGVELDIRIAREGKYHLDTDRLKALAEKLNVMGVPMIVRLNFGYRFEDKRLRPIPETYQIQQIIDELYQCGARMIVIGRGATLLLAKELRQPETSLPAVVTPSMIPVPTENPDRVSV